MKSVSVVLPLLGSVASAQLVVPDIVPTRPTPCELNCPQAKCDTSSPATLCRCINDNELRCQRQCPLYQPKLKPCLLPGKLPTSIPSIPSLVSSIFSEVLAKPTAIPDLPPILGIPQPNGLLKPQAGCECEEIFCIQSWPASCYCAHSAKQKCYEKCGGTPPGPPLCGGADLGPKIFGPGSPPDSTQIFGPDSPPGSPQIFGPDSPPGSPQIFGPDSPPGFPQIFGPDSPPGFPQIFGSDSPPGSPQIFSPASPIGSLLDERPIRARTAAPEPQDFAVDMSALSGEGMNPSSQIDITGAQGEAPIMTGSDPNAEVQITSLPEGDPTPKLTGIPLAPETETTNVIDTIFPDKFPVAFNAPATVLEASAPPPQIIDAAAPPSVIDGVTPTNFDPEGVISETSFGDPIIPLPDTSVSGGQPIEIPPIPLLSSAEPIPIDAPGPEPVPVIAPGPGTIPIDSSGPGLIPVYASSPEPVPVIAPAPETIPIDSSGPGIIPVYASDPNTIPIDAAPRPFRLRPDFYNPKRIPGCICEERICTAQYPQSCKCQNREALKCWYKCGGPHPTLQTCPPDFVPYYISRPFETKPIPLPGKQDPFPPQPCGGMRIVPLNCPSGFKCIDDPFKTGCGMACDAPGICVRDKLCGGFAGFKCDDPRQVCVDDPSDDCDPRNGGADCAGVCVWPASSKMLGIEEVAGLI